MQSLRTLKLMDDGRWTENQQETHKTHTRQGSPSSTPSYLTWQLNQHISCFPRTYWIARTSSCIKQNGTSMKCKMSNLLFHGERTLMHLQGQRTLRCGRSTNSTLYILHSTPEQATNTHGQASLTHSLSACARLPLATYGGISRKRKGKACLVEGNAPKHLGM